MHHVNSIAHMSCDLCNSARLLVTGESNVLMCVYVQLLHPPRHRPKQQLPSPLALALLLSKLPIALLQLSTSYRQDHDDRSLCCLCMLVKPHPGNRCAG